MSSTLKRRLKRIRELNEIKERLRNNLPNLDERQIRRFVLNSNSTQLLKKLIKIIFKLDIESLITKLYI